MKTQNVTSLKQESSLNDFTVDTITGEAYVSLRKSAELCGLAHNSVVHFFKDKCDITQGVSSEQLPILVQHYAQRGRPEAIKTLCLFAQAGAKAYIYHEAGIKLSAAEPKILERARILDEANRMLIVGRDMRAKGNMLIRTANKIIKDQYSGQIDFFNDHISSFITSSIKDLEKLTQ